MVRIKSKKWPLLRIHAPAAFVHPAQHHFCFSSFSNHWRDLKMAVHPVPADYAAD
jgi:hypothetical protein